jgi:hypothetical protein
MYYRITCNVMEDRYKGISASWQEAGGRKGKRMAKRAKRREKVDVLGWLTPGNDASFRQEMDPFPGFAALLRQEKHVWPHSPNPGTMKREKSWVFVSINPGHRRSL